MTSRPPVGISRMKSSNSTTGLAESPASPDFTKKSQFTHHFSREDLRLQSSGALSSPLKKLSFQSSHSNSIDKALDVTTYIVTSVDGDSEDGSDPGPLVTSPTGSPPVLNRTVQEKSAASMAQKSKFKVDGYVASNSMAKHQEMNRMESADMSYEERKALKQSKATIETDGYSASKSAAVRQDQKMVRVGDSLQQQQSMAKATAMKVTSEDSSAEKRAFQSKQQALTISGGMVKQEQNMSSSKSSLFVSKSGTMSSQMSSQMSESSSQMMSSEFSSSSTATGLNDSGMQFGMFALPSSRGLFMIQDTVPDEATLDANCADIESKMSEAIEKLKGAGDKKDEQLDVLKLMHDLMRKAWLGLGSDFAERLCDTMREREALDILIENCANGQESENGGSSETQLLSAQVLQLCLNENNNAHLAKNGQMFSQVLRFACSEQQRSPFEAQRYTKVATGILSQLFQSSQEVCKALIKHGALNTILNFCRSIDSETQRYCAFAIANLALFGGPENQMMMVQMKVPEWLLVLAFSLDEHVRYMGCLAIAALVSNKEIETIVLKSTTLNLVERFISEHSAQEFACIPVSRSYGQTKGWLRRLVPVLDSDREEAKSLIAFHFAVVAHVNKGRKNTSFFTDIGAIEALRRVASSPNAVASKYAAQALKIIGEEVPHKLSQQVPLWSVEDVKEWVKQVGFQSCAQEFTNSRVDGDLLLQLTDDMLRDDIGIRNSILRKRFLRELAHLKGITDYASCDGSTLYQVLNSLGSVYSQYTYNMLQCGVDTDLLKTLTEEQLDKECRIENSIHRVKIMDTLKALNQSTQSMSTDSKKSLDVFVSYRRSNGSQLASLLKVLLQMRGFTTFIDVERLEAGKFDANLIKSIQQAKHFILVLTPNSLDRCVGDKECKDWVHKEVVEALKNGCNIIPVQENFDWPDPEKLPEDMRAVCRFNGIRWIHEYQDACIDKLDRFMRGISADLDQQADDTVAVRRESKTPSAGNKLKKFFLNK